MPGVAEVDLVGRPDLVGPHEGLQDDDVVVDPQHRHGHPLTDRHGHQGHPVGGQQRVAQQRIRLGGGLLGLEVIRLVEEHRVDLTGRHELGDRDLLARLVGQRGQVLVGEHDHLPVGRLVALGDVIEGHDVTANAAHPLVADLPAIGPVDLAEGDVMVLGRRVELDGHIDQPEGHRALPHRPHRTPPFPVATYVTSMAHRSPPHNADVHRVCRPSTSRSPGGTLPFPWGRHNRPCGDDVDGACADR